MHPSASAALVALMLAAACVLPPASAARPLLAGPHMAPSSAPAAAATAHAAYAARRMLGTILSASAAQVSSAGSGTTATDSGIESSAVAGNGEANAKASLDWDFTKDDTTDSSSAAGDDADGGGVSQKLWDTTENKLEHEAPSSP